jgi:RNA polymerase sigma-70 factor, ECF subfamily
LGQFTGNEPVPALRHTGQLRELFPALRHYLYGGRASANDGSLDDRLALGVGMTTDEQLMLDFQQGSRDAFAELFDRYRDAVYAFFRRRVDHAERAEELAQETFLAVLKGAKRYEPRAAFRSYLFGIAFYVLSAERRKMGRQQSGQLTGEADPPEPQNADSPDNSLWVRHAIEKLDPDAREVLLLREYEQLSYAEIAALLRLPVNTVRSRLFRARIALRELLVAEPGKA